MSELNFPIQTFLLDIEKIVAGGDTYINAIIHWCEKKNVEIEYIAQLINSNSTLKSKLQLEAENLNFLPKSIRLPL